MRYQPSDPTLTQALPGTIDIAHAPFSASGGRPATRERWRTDPQADPRRQGWVFEQPYELAPGRWTISIVGDAGTLAKKEFTLRTPETYDKPLS